MAAVGTPATRRESIVGIVEAVIIMATLESMLPSGYLADNNWQQSERVAEAIEAAAESAVKLSALD